MTSMPPDSDPSGEESSAVAETGPSTKDDSPQGGSAARGVAPTRSSRWWRMLAVVAVACVVFWVGRGWAVRWCWDNAEAAIGRGALAETIPWIGRGESLAAGDPRARFLRARIARHLGNRPMWDDAIDSLSEVELTVAEGKTLRLERRLGTLCWDDRRGDVGELDRLLEDGARFYDAATTLVTRLAESGDAEGAAAIVRRWETEAPKSASLEWARGLVRLHTEDHAVALERFGRALEIEPRHDNARLGMAVAADHLHRYRVATERYAEHLAAWPGSDDALLGLSRGMRNLGRVDFAERLMREAIEGDPPTADVWLEAAEVAFLAGDYDEAFRRFERTDLGGAQTAGTVRTAATAGGLSGRPERARELFVRYLEGHHLTFRREAIEARVREDPTDRSALRQLQQIAAGQYVQQGFPPEPEETVSPLFSRHCAACHGDSGRGDGRANRHLWPPSRNLRNDPYRLVTTSNRFPSRADIRRVLRNGIAGTAMPAFADLDADDLERLVEDTYRLRQVGFRESVVGSFEAFGEPVDEAVVESIVARSGAASVTIEVPEWPTDTGPLVAAGETLYRKATCDGCHGDDGRGNPELPLFDADGRATYPRDLATDPLKGSRDRDALFARLKLGIPGTPHPANPTLDDDELMALVEFTRSLGREPKRRSTNHERSRRATRQASPGFTAAH